MLMSRWKCNLRIMILHFLTVTLKQLYTTTTTTILSPPAPTQTHRCFHLHCLIRHIARKRWQRTDCLIDIYLTFLLVLFNCLIVPTDVWLQWYVCFAGDVDLFNPTVSVRNNNMESSLFCSFYFSVIHFQLLLCHAHSLQAYSDMIQNKLTRLFFLRYYDFFFCSAVCSHSCRAGMNVLRVLGDAVLAGAGLGDWEREYVDIKEAHPNFGHPPPIHLHNIYIRR